MSVSNVLWKIIISNEHNDWIGKRSSKFDNLIPLGDKETKDNRLTFFVSYYTNGLKTQHDPWCNNFSSSNIEKDINKTISFYNDKIKYYLSEIKDNPDFNLEKITFPKNEINFSDGLKFNLKKGNFLKFDSSSIHTNIYRPFIKQRVYYDSILNERTGQMPKIFPTPSSKNLVIVVSGNGNKNIFSTLVVDRIPDVQLLFNCQCFPLYWHEKKEHTQGSLFEKAEDKYIRHDAVSDFILEQAQSRYGHRVEKEDIFYYVYGILHSLEYRKIFANDLKKMLPRLPLVEKTADFWSFSKAGRKLAELHLNYEEQKPQKEVKVTGTDKGNFIVNKMNFPNKGQKDTIIYNAHITISNIPARAYEYIVNGKSAIEWIMERYVVTTHKESGIKNDPNDWAKEHGNPRYILDLLLSVITVSLKTVDIVEGLPKVEWK
jgi:predicted helicase